MNPPYSFWADLLAKFHAASEPIQALWILALTGMVLGTAFLVMRGLSDLLRLRLPRPGDAEDRRPAADRWRAEDRLPDGSRLLHGVYQDLDGHWLIYDHKKGLQEVTYAEMPWELLRHERPDER